MQSGNAIISPTSRPLIKIYFTNVSDFYPGVQNWFSKQEIDLSICETKKLNRFNKCLHILSFVLLESKIIPIIHNLIFETLFYVCLFLGNV